jgi:hypothetical protein
MSSQVVRGLIWKNRIRGRDHQEPICLTKGTTSNLKTLVRDQRVEKLKANFISMFNTL